MSFTLMTDDMNIISKLGDRPNEDDGLDAAGLKAKFDLAGQLCKQAINALILKLSATTAAADIGFKPTAAINASTVQSAIEDVQSQLADVTQGAVANGSITAEKIADDAFDWDDVTGTLTVYASADYTSENLTFLHCAPLQMMRVEGWVKFTPTNAPTPYAQIVLPSPVPTESAIPLTADVIGDTVRMDLTAKAEIRQGGYLNVYLGNYKAADRGNSFYVFVHGWYHVNEASAS